jgi:hypothetical protein
VQGWTEMVHRDGAQRWCTEMVDRGVLLANRCARVPGAEAYACSDAGCNITDA